jgi:plastocyanin domain-containing protein
MTMAQVLVTVFGLLTILWINYYFFLAERGVAVPAVSKDQGLQQIGIEVKGGYSPAVVRVRAGRKVRLEFRREETSGCTEEVVVPAFGIRTFLPPHKTTPVEFTPEKPGSYEFTCGMGMVRGKLIVQEQQGEGSEG